MLANDRLLDQVLKTTGPLSSDAAQVAISIAYDISFGLHDHYDKKQYNPLATVAMHPAENYLPYSGWLKALERYERQEINSTYGLSLTEYLSLPRDVTRAITERVLARARELDKAEAKGKRDARDRKHPDSAWRHLQKPG